ncbi:meiosis-specific coiled-coil domain-containing protein MEIOC-like [Vombatus ursinus]|uniref:Meiosis specific with coiled-coil domain n=2 Tax=Vombatus ursinus TaxID=29139 RepID=A0A4X2KQ44_VOMUR|nr:meiosis-specific coiled-coil domain-containing protein MEIOC-like [Vombatus ursinus]XP_027692879.1 meiosis-specific coiled-coil domain-containing protein MEIOC-like [Vombatus ursinus]XP_027697967.1 meiosis-specific coiled-coil domain-containing protein MEIOC-like [Vombatus ursinus]
MVANSAEPVASRAAAAAAEACYPEVKPGFTTLNSYSCSDDPSLWKETVHSEDMVQTGDCFNLYKSQVNCKQQGMDTQLFSPLLGEITNTPSLESSGLYSNWSVYGDDTSPPTAFQDYANERAQINLCYSGNGPDTFGLVSNILEKPNIPDPVTDWNSLSRFLPPTWTPNFGNDDDYSGYSLRNSVEDFSNFIETQNFNQGHFETSPDIENLQSAFDNLRLVESWLSPSDHSNQLPDNIFKSTYLDNSAFKTNSIIQPKGFPLQNEEFNQSETNYKQTKLNNDYEKNCSDLNSYFQNIYKDSASIQKESWKPDRANEKIMKINIQEQMKCSNDLGSLAADPYVFHENHLLPKINEGMMPSQQIQTSVPPPLYFVNQPFPEENLSAVIDKKSQETSSLNDPSNFNFMGNFEDNGCQFPRNSKEILLKPLDYDLSINTALQNGNCQSLFREHIWVDGNMLSPVLVENSPFVKPIASGCQPSSGVSVLSSGSPMHQSLISPSYYPQTPPVPFRKEGRLQMPNGVHSGLRFPNSNTENQKPNIQMGCFPHDPLTSRGHHYCKIPAHLSSNCLLQQNAASEYSDRYRVRKKQSLDDRKDRKNLIPQPSYIGQNRQQFNIFRKKQEKNSVNMSDFINPSILPAVPFVSELKQNPNFTPFNPSPFMPTTNFTFPPSTFPLSELVDVFHYGGLTNLNPFVSDLFCREVTPPYFAFPPPFNKYRPPRNRSGPANELHTQLEECYEQWRALEKERKKTEADLARNFPGKRVSTSNNTPVSRLPANPSRVDRLIMDQLKEQARVLTLLRKMEKLRGSPVHENISITLERHLEAIHATQAKRKDELVNAANPPHQGIHYNNEKDVLALALVIKELTFATRKTRTALWCALQMTLPKTCFGLPVKQEEIERVLRELCPQNAGTQEKIIVERESHEIEKGSREPKVDSRIIA